MLNFLFRLYFHVGEKSGTVVPSTSDDTRKTALYDPHDYDEVPIDETATMPRPPVVIAVPGPVPDPIPEDDYSVVSTKFSASASAMALPYPQATPLFLSDMKILKAGYVAWGDEYWT